MKRKHKYSLLTALTLLGVLLVLSIGFESGRVKTEIIEQFQQKTQHALAIDGPVRIKLFPYLALEAKGLSLAGKNCEETSEENPTHSPPDANPKEGRLYIEKLTGALELLPFLNQKLVIRSIEITHPDFRVTRCANGKTSFDALLNLKPAEETESPLEIRIDRIALSDGQLLFQDDMNQQQWALDQLYWRSTRLGKKAEGTLEAGGRLKQKMLEAHLSTAYQIDLSHQQDEAKDPAANILRLNDFHLLLNEYPDNPATKTTPSFSAELTAENIEGFINTPSEGSMAINQLILLIKTQPPEKPLTAKIQLASLSLNSKLDGHIPSLKASISQAGEDPSGFFAQFHMSDLALAKGEGLLQMDWEGHWQQHPLKGKTRLPFQFSLQENGWSLAIPEFKGETLLGKGQFLTRPAPLNWQGKSQLDSKGNGKGQFNLELNKSAFHIDWSLKEKKRLTFTSRLNQLDLDQYLNFPESPEEPAQDNVAMPDENNAGYNSIELEGRFSADSLKLKGIKMEKLNALIQLSDGRLKLQSSKARQNPPQKTSQKPPENAL